MPETPAPKVRLPRSRRRSILIAVIGLGLLGLYWETRPTAFDGQALSVSEAHAQAADGRVLLVDIRRPDEWARTGIGEDATPLDMRRDDFEVALAELTGGDRTRPVALICAGGVRSARMAQRLADAGYENVIDVPEGMEGSAAGPGWIGAGLPLRTPGAAEGATE